LILANKMTFFRFVSLNFVDNLLPFTDLHSPLI
jgi:hypothetical protein